MLCGDESPVNVLRKDTDEDGQPKPGAPHVVTLRTPDERLTWYAPIGARSSAAIAGLGVLDGFTGYLVRDDYAGWHQFDDRLAGVQQCAAHYRLFALRGKLYPISYAHKAPEVAGSS